MKPLSPITAHVKISSSYIFRLFSGCKIKVPKVCPLVVPSHKLRLAAFCLILSASPRANASSMSIIVTGDVIVIAVDGVQTSTTGGKINFHEYCKVRQEENVFFAAVGVYSIPDIQFDLWYIMRNAVMKSKTLAMILDATETAVLRRFQAVVNFSKSADPKNYARWLTGIPVISLAFARFEDGVPTVVAAEFPVDKNGVITRPAPRTLRGIGGKVDIGAFGYNDQIRAATSSPAWGAMFTSDPIGFSSGLIEREIEASTREKRYDVGRPISIVRITSNYRGWEPGYEGACRQ
jgi:hypothetical protein